MCSCEKEVNVEDPLMPLSDRSGPIQTDSNFTLFDDRAGGEGCRGPLHCSPQPHQQPTNTTDASPPGPWAPPRHARPQCTSPQRRYVLDQCHHWKKCRPYQLSTSMHSEDLTHWLYFLWVVVFLHRAGNPMFVRMPMMNGMMGPSQRFPTNPGGPCIPDNFSPLHRMPFTDNPR